MCDCELCNTWCCVCICERALNVGNRHCRCCPGCKVGCCGKIFCYLTNWFACQIHKTALAIFASLICIGGYPCIVAQAFLRCICRTSITVPQVPPKDTVRIVFSSCYSTEAPDERTRAWPKMRMLNPDVTVLDGDNVYINWHHCCIICCWMPCMGCNQANNNPEDNERQVAQNDCEIYDNQYNILVEQAQFDNSWPGVILPVIKEHDGRSYQPYGGIDSTNGFLHFMRKLNDENSHPGYLQDAIEHVTHLQVQNPEEQHHGDPSCQNYYDWYGDGIYYYYDVEKKGMKLRFIILDTVWWQGCDEVSKEHDCNPLGDHQYKWMQAVIEDLDQKPDADDWILFICAGYLIGGPKVTQNECFNCTEMPYGQVSVGCEDGIHELINHRTKKTFILDGEIHANAVYKHAADGVYEFTVSSVSHSMMNYQLWGWRFVLCFMRCCRAKFGGRRETPVSKMRNENGFGVIDVSPDGWRYAFLDNQIGTTCCRKWNESYNEAEGMWDIQAELMVNHES